MKKLLFGLMNSAALFQTAEFVVCRIHAITTFLSEYEANNYDHKKNGYCSGNKHVTVFFEFY